MSNGQVYPWMREDFGRLCGLEKSGRLPHGLLFAGPADIGKKDLALAFANYLLCAAEGNKPCGSCAPCLLCRAGTHPDLLQVAPRDSRQVRMEQIRDMIDWSMQTANQGGRKVALIDPADAMNAQSSNALLKCLEEPGPGTVIVLISSEPMSLLPTIRSRCQAMGFRLPDAAVASDWLREKTDLETDAGILLDIAEGRPLKALSLDAGYLSLRESIAGAVAAVATGKTSPMRFASLMAKEEPGAVLELLYHLVADSVGFSLAGEKHRFRNGDLRPRLEAYAASVGLAERQRLLGRAVAARKLLGETSNANVAMLLEWVFMAAKEECFPANSL